MTYSALRNVLKSEFVRTKMYIVLSKKYINMIGPCSDILITVFFLQFLVHYECVYDENIKF